MPGNPRLDRAFEIRKHWNKAVALIGLRVANSIFACLTFP
jgi:hypothetical protein